ncbi:hypothetical protein PENTCL1PPCAC_23550, partial [Pristionchus entomophagus]
LYMAAPYQPALKASSEENEVRRSEEVLYWTRLKQVAVFSEPSQVTSVAMSSKHPHTIATTAGVRLSIFNSVLCEQTAVMTRFKKAVHGATFRGDGTLIAIGGDEGKLRIFDQFTGNAPRAPLRSWRVSSCSVHAVRFGAIGGRSVYSLADDGHLKQWDFSTTVATPVTTIKAHTDAARVVVPSATNEHLVLTGGYDHTVKVWDVRSPPEAGPSLSFDSSGPVEAALFLPREQLVAVAAGPTVRLYDITTGGRCLQSITAHHKAITSMCLVRGGEQMLTVSIDKRMNVVRTADLSLVHSTGLAAPILDLAASPDDNKVAVGMGSLIALLRREEAPTDAVSSLVAGAGGVIAAPRKTYAAQGQLRSVNVETRGEKELKEVEPVVKVASEFKLSHEDTLLKRYRHAALVTRAFTNKGAKANSMPDVVVGWLSVVVARMAMGRALAGQQPAVLVNVTKFVSRNLFKFHYFDTLSAVAESLFEVCADSPTPALSTGLVRLREAIARELSVQKELAQTIGALEMLTTPVLGGGAEGEGETDMDELFGEPVYSVIPLSMSEEKEDEGEGEEGGEKEEAKPEKEAEEKEEEKMEVDQDEQENKKAVEEPKSAKKKREKKRNSLGKK